jgi:hypothetical protein
MFRHGEFILAAVSLLAPGLVKGGTLLDTVGGPLTVTDLANFASLTYIQVGASSVPIGGFGVFSSVGAENTNVEWLIFSGAGNLLYQSAAVAEPAGVFGTDLWFNSPAIAFTLTANQSYYFGMMAEDPNHPGQPGPVEEAYDMIPESANGLTAPAMSGVAYLSFANPVFFANAGGPVVDALRIYDSSGPGAPEPANSVLTASGLAILVIVARRKLRCGRTA